jgi:hypothetical protein
MSYASCIVRALVAPDSLCYPIILGLPFLSHNNLVTDQSKESCINKKTGYDLLAPITEPPPLCLPYLSPKAKCLKICNIHLAVQRELKACIAAHRDPTHETTSVPPIVFAVAVRQRVEQLALQATWPTLKEHDAAMKKRFDDHFPDDIPHVSQLPSDAVHRIRLKDPDFTLKKCTYSCPCKYQQAWQTLIGQHLAAGRIHPSNSPYASPAFLIPMADPNALPRWVNDYREINAHTIPDNHPLPKISKILADVYKGKIWAKIDMTNSFYETLMHPDNIKFTAVTTPLGLYEFVVMPMGG